MITLYSIGFLFLTICLFIIPIHSVSGKFHLNCGFEKKIQTIFFEIGNVAFVAKCANNTEPRIYGGKPVDIEETPYQVFIKFVNRQKQSDQFMCGGAIIGERWVLTAHHCLRYGKLWTLCMLHHPLIALNVHKLRNYLRFILSSKDQTNTK